MIPSSREPAQHSQALWPWIVMPAVVLIVFCILHFDVRRLGSPADTPATVHSESSASE
jgi:hypothetical protein